MMNLYGSTKDPNYLNKINGRVGHDRMLFAPNGRQLRRLQEREQKKLNTKGSRKHNGFVVDGLDKL